MREVEFLLLLNDDTTVSDGWIDYLVETAQRRDAAVVGSRILWPDGRLQEAGSLIWAEAQPGPSGVTLTAKIPPTSSNARSTTSVSARSSSGSRCGRRSAG